MRLLGLVATRRLCALALGAAVALSWGERASACQCRLYDQELLTLELESVTVDGAASTDLTPWQTYDVTLHPDSNGEALTFRWQGRGSETGRGSGRYDQGR